MTVGDVRYHREFPSRVLPDRRDILVYLPPGYDALPHRRYPVLYLHDGQNVFDGETSFVRGQEWQVDETAERLIAEGMIEPLIIVGIPNSINRIDEYTPTFDAKMDRGGKASSYGVFLTRELKRMIDRTYRTEPGRSSTALGGSSLGGLVTLFLGLRHPKIFGSLAVMSPSIWWDQRSVLGELERYRDKHRPAIWLDSGTEEGTVTLRNARDLRDRLVNKGWEHGKTLHYHEAEGADHSERAWAARVPIMLRALFPKRT